MQPNALCCIFEQINAVRVNIINSGHVFGNSCTNSKDKHDADSIVSSFYSNGFGYLFNYALYYNWTALYSHPSGCGLL
jgi:hypothetical protein